MLTSQRPDKTNIPLVRRGFKFDEFTGGKLYSAIKAKRHGQFENRKQI